MEFLWSKLQCNILKGNFYITKQANLRLWNYLVIHVYKLYLPFKDDTDRQLTNEKIH
jgi:hypothetical protein